MAKIKIDNELFDRVKKHAASSGYSSVEEFVAHVLEQEVEGSQKIESDDAMRDRLKGLGYLE